MKTVEVSNYEQNSSQTVFAKEVFSHFALSDPKAQCFWILGEDNFKSLPYWKDIDSYAKSLIWLVFPRTQEAKPSGLLSKRLLRGSCAYHWTKGHRQVQVASHLIREALQSKQGVARVLKWIPVSILKSVREAYKPKDRKPGGKID